MEGRDISSVIHDVLVEAKDQSIGDGSDDEQGCQQKHPDRPSPTSLRG